MFIAAFVLTQMSWICNRTSQKQNLLFGDSTSVYMFLLMMKSMKIRKLVVNEPRRTLAICSLKACHVYHLRSGFYGKTVYQQSIEL